MLVLALVSVSGETIHVATNGKADGTGTADDPIGSLPRLERILIDRPGVTEIIFRAGVYRGSFVIPLPNIATDAKLPQLLVRADEGRVIIDGAQSLTDEDQPQPVKGAPGVYVIHKPEKFRTRTDRVEGKYPRLWDLKERRRYLLVADERTVRQFPGTFTFTEDALFVHTSDNKPPAEHRIEISMVNLAGDYGFTVSRPKTTVRGFHFRNFFRNPVFSAGIMVYGKGSVVENCVTTNCPRGFYINGEDVTIRNCRARDVGGGLRCGGARPVIEDCVFTKVRDSFEVPIPKGSQEDSAVLLYFSTKDTAVVRRNVIQGFSGGVFIKTLPGKFLVENNTIIDASLGFGGSFAGRPDTTITCRRNLFINSRHPIQISRPGGANLKTEQNCIWSAPWKEVGQLSEILKAANQNGAGNFIADARTASLSADDCRLLKDSLCLPDGPEGFLIGARGQVTATFKDTSPPRVSLSRQPNLVPLPGQTDQFLSFEPEVSVAIEAWDCIGRATLMKVRVDGRAWSQALPLSRLYQVSLAQPDRPYRFAVIASDNAGNWSQPQEISIVRRAETPRIQGEPVIRANSFGATISFRTNVECMATGFFGSDSAPMRTRFYQNESRFYYYAEGTDPESRRDHVLAAIPAKKTPGTSIDFQIDLTTRSGVWPGKKGKIKLEGKARNWHVSTSGRDAEDAGTETNPCHTLQYAADRALPGDVIVLAPGVYGGSTVLTHGGVAGAPIVIRSAEKWGAVLDGLRKVRSPLSLVRAPHVEIRDLELRWYTIIAGIYVFRSPNATVRGCRIWNAFWWQKRPQGRGLFVAYSPEFTAERNMIFKNDGVMYIYKSPRSTIRYNTGTGTSHSGIDFDESADGSIFKNNDLAFMGNDVLGVRLHNMEDLKTFESDYNNLGTVLRNFVPRKGAAPNLSHPDAPSRSKAVTIFYRLSGTWERGVGGYPKAKFLPNKTTPPEKRGHTYLRFRNIEDWREFSGHDRHSVFVDPMRRDMPLLRFELSPDSPLIGAGEDGTTIGAMPVHLSKRIERKSLKGALVDAYFDTDADGFVLQKDAFRKTRQPNYASGEWIKAGKEGGALRIMLGGVDKETVENMSAGWRRPFNLDKPAKLALMVRCMLRQSPQYEQDEYSEVMISLDGKPLLVAAKDYFERITGDGKGGGYISTGWMELHFVPGTLKPGEHQLVIGAFNNKKTSDNEFTEFFVDRVAVAPSEK